MRQSTIVNFCKLWYNNVECIIMRDSRLFMKRLNNIFCLILVSIIIFIFVACSPNISEDSNAESAITEYVNTYYTITKDNIDLYKK